MTLRLGPGPGLGSTEDGKRYRRDIELNNIEEMNNVASSQIDDDTEPRHNGDDWNIPPTFMKYVNHFEHLFHDMYSDKHYEPILPDPKPNVSWMDWFNTPSGKELLKKHPAQTTIFLGCCTDGLGVVLMDVRCVMYWGRKMVIT